MIMIRSSLKNFLTELWAGHLVWSKPGPKGGGRLSPDYNSENMQENYKTVFAVLQKHFNLYSSLSYWTTKQM